jgi:hypothetical protein
MQQQHAFTSRLEKFSFNIPANPGKYPMNVRIIGEFNAGPWGDGVRVLKIIEMEKFDTQCQCPTCTCALFRLTCINPFTNDNSRVEYIEYKHRTRDFIYQHNLIDIYQIPEDWTIVKLSGTFRGNTGREHVTDYYYIEERFTNAIWYRNIFTWKDTNDLNQHYNGIHGLRGQDDEPRYGDDCIDAFYSDPIAVV